MARIVTVNFNVIDPKTRKVASYKIGDKLTPARERKLTPRQLNDYTQIMTQVTTKVRYTDKELELLCDLYIRYSNPGTGVVNKKRIVEEFMSVYDTHPKNSVDLYVQVLKKNDNSQSEVGLDGIATYALTYLRGIAPTRFKVS